jgi:hypothetical protein
MGSFGAALLASGLNLTFVAGVTINGPEGSVNILRASARPWAFT